MSGIKFQARNGQTYTIVIDESGEEISVALAGARVGEISLRYVEDDDFPQSDHYHITHLALDRCRRQGLGRRCLQLHREVFNSPISAGTNNGSINDDGSHLTGDGPAFIETMRQEGLIVSPSVDEYDYRDHFDE